MNPLKDAYNNELFSADNNFLSDREFELWHDMELLGHDLSGCPSIVKEHLAYGPVCTSSLQFSECSSHTSLKPPRDESDICKGYDVAQSLFPCP